MNMKTILRTLVGSRAHGLHTETSDYDYRGVFLVPTADILSLGYKEKAVAWLEGQGEDATSYELAHFLHLATHSNPSILEVMVSPVLEETEEGKELRALFPYLWSSNGVLNAFCGYSKNQQKKFLEDKDARPGKYACAYLRVLLLGIELLEQGTMTVNIEEQERKLNFSLKLYHEPDTDMKTRLISVKNNVFSKGIVINWAEGLTERIKIAYNKNPNKETDLAKVNEFLLKVRKNNWNG
jgi:uncharacterized protein